ncbi:Multiple RNA-binding domain-containing protein 1 [Zancudomyces culisetae]|uniref:Multiple RNA-binding domain-containing protein 1 n=1 Tax=Zancudomyces culisetae TaxID=1213189 RepID=A0A1R1PMP6_ZANCU|nr:Multiple RNA-binding domain-containing protein 1 [Zancudomyces culisetae]OMH83022.1 Multiple RNA-binding domain-containing protein 1 [Zancudomyces culisetae]|eukprot:OMH82236.1 Multiple RNA-binding domain-containing protein 1 [Zancudomyces culisetae]
MSMRITSNLLRATRATRNCLALTNQARNFCVRTLFVGNIPYVSNETHLQECFGNFGKIDKIHMPKGPDGNHKGYGFVSFIVGERPTPNEDGTPKIVIPTDQEIQEAEKLVSRVIQKVSGLDYMGRTLRVDYASNDSAGSKKNSFFSERRQDNSNRGRQDLDSNPRERRFRE